MWLMRRCRSSHQNAARSDWPGFLYCKGYWREMHRAGPSWKTADWWSDCQVWCTVLRRKGCWKYCKNLHGNQKKGADKKYCIFTN